MISLIPPLIWILFSIFWQFLLGHRVDNIPHLPLVVDDKLESVEKTKDLISFLKRFGAFDDVERVVDAKVVRSGVGKLRNKRYKIRKGPLFVYEGASQNLPHAVRNIPGVEICNVHRLNLRQLAPGGTLGNLKSFLIPCSK